MKYHITDDGAKVCVAEIVVCKYGDGAHYEDKLAAERAYESKMSDLKLPPVAKRSPSSVKPSAAFGKFLKKSEPVAVEEVADKPTDAETVKRLYDEAVARRLLASESVGEPVRTKQLGIGVQVVSCDTELSKVGYTTGQTVTGVIDHTQITPKTYLELGFDKRQFNKRPQSDAADKMSYDVSAEEMSVMTKEEKKAIRFFTGKDYKWFNKALYERKNILIEQFETQVKGLDSAMEKAPKVQKVVYRGVRRNSELFGNSSIREWTNENMKPGTEVVFDGYQSSTTSTHVAEHYQQGSSGLVYEIMTPEGLNVTSESVYTQEIEVILPRSSRYMVVGMQQSPAGGATVQLVAINSKGEVLDGTNADIPPSIETVNPPKIETP